MAKKCQFKSPVYLRYSLFALNTIVYLVSGIGTLTTLGLRNLAADSRQLHFSTR